MLHQNILESGRSALVIIDMQDAFRTKIADFAEVAARMAVMVRAARLLDLPTLVTEQYPKGLGHTAQEILDALPDSVQIIEKTTFSSCGVEQFRSQLERASPRHVLVCGIEAHICVLQTSLDLLARGIEVYLLVDCITSRIPENKRAALARLTQAGAIQSTLEMALFEMMRTADAPQFKAIQSLIK